MKRSKAVVVFSGGQDSTTLLYFSLKRFDEVHAISFFYGQTHEVELRQAKEITNQLGVPHKIIDISFLGKLVDSALTKNIEGVTIYDNHPTVKSAPASYVPNRNAIMLSLSHAYAQSIGATNLVTGITTSDFWKFKPVDDVHWQQGYFFRNLWKINISNVTGKISETNSLMSDDIILLYNIAKDTTKDINESHGKYFINLKDNEIDNFNNTTAQVADKLLIKEGLLCVNEFLKYDQPDEIKTWVAGYVDSLPIPNDINVENISAKDCYNMGLIVNNEEDSSIQKALKSFFTIIYSDLRSIKNKGKIDKIFFKDDDLNQWGAAYPDCTPQFKHKIEAALNAGSKGNITIHAPLQYLNKSLIFALADELGGLDTVLTKSFTCYEGRDDILNEWGFGCGECPSCKLRKAGYEDYKLLKNKCSFKPTLFNEKGELK